MSDVMRQEKYKMLEIKGKTENCYYSESTGLWMQTSRKKFKECT